MMPSAERRWPRNKDLREDYTLRYMLDVETQGSTSLLNHTRLYRSDAPTPLP